MTSLAKAFAGFLAILLSAGLPGGQSAHSGTAAADSSRLKTFPTGCGTLAYEERGSGDPIIVLAGGPGMNPAYVEPVARSLAAGGRRAVLLHQRGTGKSAAAISCRDRMTLAGAIDDLDDLRVNLGLKKLTLAGHSFGAMLAMAYAQRHPDRVSGLLLIDSGPIKSSSFPTEEAAIRARLTPAEQAALIKAKDGAAAEKIERYAVFAHAENAELLERSISADEPLWYEAAGDLLGPELARFDVSRGLQAAPAPVIMIFGRRDPGFFTAEQIRSLHPQAALIVIEDAGHYPWLEAPDETSEALKRAAATLP
jgi:proline iminopeptidase